MTAVGVMLPLNGGEDDLVLYLYDKGTLLNSGGDSLVEVGASDYFEADVSEALATTYQAVVIDGVGDAIYQGTLYAGETVVDQVPSIGSVSDEQIDEIATRSASAIVASADKQIVVRRRSPMHNRATNDLYLLQSNDYLFVQGKHEEFETDLSGVAADYTVAILVRGVDGNADIAFEGVGTLHDVDGSIWIRVEWPNAVLSVTGKYSWTTEVRTVAGDYVDSPVRGGMTIVRNDHPPA